MGRAWLVAAAVAVCCAGTTRAENVSDSLDRLVRAYPDQLAGHQDGSVLWRDGTRMAAGRADQLRSFEERLRHSSILDQLLLPYPAGDAPPPGVDVDPGRFRNEAFFKKMYGDCTRGEVARNMVPIVWLKRSWGKTVSVTRINGIAEKLARISDEIETLPQEIRRAAFPIAGVFSCRPVADTGQMSMHGYGAAIDLNLAVSDYWLWSSKSKAIPYKNRMPRQIVEIFERHGFIWGGKWYHYDTMHFEYRPELLLPRSDDPARPR